MGINYSANRPDPDDPGGLGAEESGIERTGPTQCFLFAIQKGGRWAEVGRHYDSANDPVTAWMPDTSGFLLDLGTVGPGNSGARATALLRRRSVGAIMSL
jgi:hypothetical protein